MTATSSTKVSSSRLKRRRTNKPIPFGSSGKTLSRALIRKAFRHLCESSQTSRGLLAWLLYESGEWQQLLSFSVKPSDYNSSAVYYDDVRIFTYFKKYADIPVAVDREGPAMEVWYQSEARCKETNIKFRDRMEGKFNFSPFTEAVIRRASGKIRYVLGDLSFERVREECRHGPGSDLGTRRNETAAYWKYAPRGHCTPGALAMMHDLFSEYHVCDLAEQSVLVNANRLGFVPKTSLIDRIICTEPRWNMFLQLGIGEVMSYRLRKKAGVDISDQGRNQSLASAAYVDQLATIDLSAASDSVAKYLVFELLPDDWFDALATTRSPCTLLPDGRMWLNEKFSSMGNGYTFPLETLIFWSIATSVVNELGGDVSKVGVYGDDIIVPNHTAQELIGVLKELGFETNISKSFIEGNFYESCGKDFFAGVPVRPFYLRKEPDSWAAVVEFVNGLCFNSDGHPGRDRDWALHAELRKWLDKRAPPKSLPLGPPGAPGAIWDPGFHTIPCKRGWDGSWYRGWVFKPKRSGRAHV